MTPKGIKASKVLKSRYKAKAVDWVIREYSRGTRDVAVKVTTSKGKRTPRQISGVIENNEPEAISGEVTLPSMDVDQTFWSEEPATDQPKRVSSLACPPRMAFYNPSVSPAHLHGGIHC